MKILRLMIVVSILAGTAVLAARILKFSPSAPADAHAEEEAHGHSEDESAEHHEQVKISDEAARSAGIVLEKSGPATLRMQVALNGKIRANEERTAHVMPRYPGIVKAVMKKLGDEVRKGETLLVVESNESLRPYEIASEIDGTVIAKNVTPGEFVDGREVLLTIANLGDVWADFAVYRRDFSTLRQGQPVTVDGGDGVGKTDTRIDYIAPFGEENSQTMRARAVVANATGRWRPGLFVRGHVVTGERDVPVAVKSDALQELEGETVVFVREGGAFEAAPVVVGERDGEWVEIKSGLEAGTPYAARNSYVIKADFGKAGAAHEH